MPVKDTILLNENVLFVRISQGDEAAFSEIFYSYVQRLFPFVKKMTRSAQVAEEVVQEVFVSLWANRKKLTDIENCSSYIFTIAVNKTFNHLRSKAIREKYLGTMVNNDDGSDNNTMDTIDFHESQYLVHKLVNQLPPQKKTIYKLTRDKGMSHDEVAVQLGISKNTVKNHLVEALRFLKATLQKYKEVSIIFFVFIL